MKTTVVVFVALMGLAVSEPTIIAAEDELNRYHAACKSDAGIVVNGYEFKTSGLSCAMIVDAIKTAFAGKTQTSKEGSDDALFLIKAGYRLKPGLKNESIREAAYRLCMKEKLSTDR